jgi:hypothetical protein
MHCIQYSEVAEVTVQTHFTYRVIKFKLVQFNTVGTLVRRWIPSSNQRWTARHYLLTRLAHSIRLITIISIWWLDESFQLTIHSRISDHLIDHIISRLYLMTFNDYVTNRVFSMWAEYLTCKKIENHLYKTLCNHLIKNYSSFNSSINVVHSDDVACHELRWIHIDQSNSSDQIHRFILLNLYATDFQLDHQHDHHRIIIDEWFFRDLSFRWERQSNQCRHENSLWKWTESYHCQSYFHQ